MDCSLINFFSLLYLLFLTSVLWEMAQDEFFYTCFFCNKRTLSTVHMTSICSILMSIKITICDQHICFGTIRNPIIFVNYISCIILLLLHISLSHTCYCI